MGELNLYILTSNCARSLVDDAFGAHIFDPLGPDALAPDLIVLSLQEIAPIAYSFIGGTYLAPYFDAFVRAVKSATVKRWNESYVNVVQENTGMTGLMVFAKPDAANKISQVKTGHVSCGFNGLGNKGAVGARLCYATADHSSETVSLTFVAAHLAPMEEALAQRNRDWQTIVEGLVFTNADTTPEIPPGKQAGSDESTALLGDQDQQADNAESSSSHLFAPNSYLFLAGDLNYRTSDTSPSQDDVTRFPRRDASPEDATHFSHLLKHDQLAREMREGRTFHGLSEAPIHFPPTYKYSSAASEAARVSLANGRSETEWIWSSHRWPSWCDRILYLDRASQSGDSWVKPRAYDALPLFPHSDHRPVALAVSVPLRSTDTPSGPETVVAPFAIDPSWRSRRDAARRKELVVGILAYLGLTREGNGLVLASTLGIVGAWVVLRSLWLG
ncbi:hypothetical protein N7468_008011 [Penicillium chermesinum]|uniref:Inositol polyphosphate-related phosphatase domain-containing protein n=1 Tax=Penicillium chermesinum TaxID=63820 RepID=A0A9W9NNZ2_9EURO|nr:uncharacterized protein N7468_008011 [Penicillium chermesinum]KAJ5223469.1 hypothetical protein N7468_008011 [Penicillium chermesinum]KAJ6155699.1 hypothetical protein N7470_006265 [Penicillium chermesinum]